jgi:hypothetical protein
MKELKLGDDNRSYTFECPHCSGIIQVIKTQIASKVFRHAILKSTGKQINPHAPKAECEKLIAEDLIWGCGKPFKFIKLKGGGWSHVEACDYI